MWRRIVLGTLVVGVLDITEPIIFYWLWRDVAPIGILQAVAAGLIGRPAATSGGVPTALLGLAIHFCISFVVVLIYHLAARRIRVLAERPVLMGALYGIAVYLMMNFVVLPLTATGAPRLSPWPVVASGVFAHLFCVGIPAALSFRRSPSAS